MIRRNTEDAVERTKRLRAEDRARVLADRLKHGVTEADFTETNAAAIQYKKIMRLFRPWAV